MAPLHKLHDQFDVCSERHIHSHLYAVYEEDPRLKSIAKTSEWIIHGFRYDHPSDDDYHMQLSASAGHLVRIATVRRNLWCGHVYVRTLPSYFTTPLKLKHDIVDSDIARRIGTALLNRVRRARLGAEFTYMVNRSFTAAKTYLPPDLDTTSIEPFVYISYRDPSPRNPPSTQYVNIAEGPIWASQTACISIHTSALEALRPIPNAVHRVQRLFQRTILSIHNL